MNERKKSFLIEIAKQTINGEKPVHYSSIAKKMNVSNWSAYDMMLSLSKDGMLEKVFENDKGPGRTRLLFNLTKEGSLEIEKDGKNGSLLNCVVSMNFVLSIAHIHLADFPLILDPKTTKSGKWVESFAKKVFERIKKEEKILKTANGAIRKIDKFYRLFFESLPKLNKVQLASLGSIISTSLTVMGNFQNLI